MSNSPQFVSAQWVCPVSSPPVENGVAVIENGRLAEVVSYERLSADLRAPLPQPGTILTPGLVNVHAHLEQSFPAVISKDTDEPFTAWLLRVIEATRGHGSPEEKAQRCEAGVSELLRTGTTCVNDIASGPESMHALAQVGLRALVALEVFHPAAEPLKIEHWLAQYQRLSEALGAVDFGSRLRLGLSPHSPYNVSPSAWNALQTACTPDFIHSHVAEFEDECLYLAGQPSGLPALHEAVLKQHFSPEQLADTPVSLLAEAGLLSTNTILAHAIHTTAVDRQLLADSGATVAHCPRSNLALHGQTLRWADWEGSGVPLGLGTDGRLSTETLDLRDEARCAMRLHGWSAATALDRMTRQGARVLGLDGEIGTLEPGKAADLVLWQSTESIAAHPEEALMAPSTQAIQAMVDGRICWEMGSS